ncbi:flagellar hook-associated protein 3 [Paraclostridium sordellii]|uniref:flagellin N-terminal helical domain-containing protein n=1 Tax=Paraclostridium sordellii TaxID=1505 RepID=UPI0003863D59|nr:flagellar hook-associated protein 3 [Paeniclostridium sordellii]EPZ62749.1 flagellar hook-associated protein 3 [[Clostridium] sordellii VPI 9048] [Paeniclostridium sordellii VPI 9048]CEK39048.1 Flagellar hook-associated protein FlgL (orHAP3) [[Clostridium] sordellii] [Paeniclostridium sordellii]
MRITNSSMITNHMFDTQQTLERMDTLNRQLDTSKQINRVSDDPHKAIKIMNLNNEIKFTEKYNQNAEETIGWMNNTDSTLQEVGDLLGEIKTNILKVGNGTYSDEEIKAIHAEMNEKIKELGECLNASHGGRHMFSGTEVNEVPMIMEEKDGVVTLKINSSVNDKDLKAELSDGITSDYNVSAKEIFEKDGKNYLDQINNLSKVMNDISNGKDVEANKKKLLGTVKDDIDGLFNHTIDTRTTFGVRVNTAEKIKDFNDENILNMKAVLSSAQDVDHVKKFIELKSAELVYNASVQVGAKLIQPTVLDYLR